MKLTFITTWMSILGLICVCTSFLLLSIQKLAELDNMSLEIFGLVLNQKRLWKIFIFSLPFASVLSLIAIYQIDKDRRKTALKDFLLNNSLHGEMTSKDKSKVLGKMNFIIKQIQLNIREDAKNAWHWEIKLKSVTFTLNQLLKGQKIEAAELTQEEKDQLLRESSLLNLKVYKQYSGKDCATSKLLKSKMALYRKHRQQRG